MSRKTFTFPIICNEFDTVRGERIYYPNAFHNDKTIIAGDTSAGMVGSDFIVSQNNGTAEATATLTGTSIYYLKQHFSAELDELMLIPMELGIYRYINGELKCEIHHVPQLQFCHQSKVPKVMKCIIEKAEVAGFVTSLAVLGHHQISPSDWDLVKSFHESCEIVYALHHRSVVRDLFKPRELPDKCYCEFFGSLKEYSDNVMKFNDYPVVPRSLETYLSDLGKSLYRTALAKELVAMSPLPIATRQGNDRSIGFPTGAILHDAERILSSAKSVLNTITDSFIKNRN